MVVRVDEFIKRNERPRGRFGDEADLPPEKRHPYHRLPKYWPRRGGQGGILKQSPAPPGKK